jgi:hypothetical protein
MKNQPIEFNTSSIWETQQAVTEMQWAAVGGRIRPDQAVAFILKSETIRKRLVTALVDLERLTAKANDGTLEP